MQSRTLYNYYRNTLQLDQMGELTDCITPATKAMNSETQELIFPELVQAFPHDLYLPGQLWN